MSDTNDGGPAFPVRLLDGQELVCEGEGDGMSLRDWFAGQALAGILASGFSEGLAGADSNIAYFYDDVMLAARGDSDG